MIKRVLYCGLFELPDLNAAAHRVRGISKAFALCGVKTVFLSAKHSVSSLCRMDDDIYAEPYPCSASSRIKYMTSTENIKLLLDKYDDIDAVMLYNPNYSLLKKVRGLTKKCGIKLLVDLTEWCGTTDGSQIKRAIKNIDFKLAKNGCAKNCDGMIVISSLMYSYYEKFNIPLLKLPPMNDIQDEKWHAEPLRDTPCDVPTFCFVGSVGGDKELLPNIVDAFSRVKESVLTVVGTTGEEFKRYFNCDDIPDNVIFHGRLDHNTSIRYVLGADACIFIRPCDERNSAGFPTKFTEAFTCGIAILTTDVSDIRQYMEKENAGMIIPDHDAESIECGIRRMIGGKIPRSDLRDTFDFRHYTDACRAWLNKL